MAVRRIYFGFDSRAEMLKLFSAPRDALDGARVLLGYYDHGDYEGQAFVLFERAGKLFEVNGGHCSCYGLEGQWEPEETTPEAVLVRRPWDEMQVRLTHAALKKWPRSSSHNGE